MSAIITETCSDIGQIKKKFVHLHLHTTYSLLDGAQLIGDIKNPKKEFGMLNIIQKLGMDAVAITDHGNMFGAIDFFKKASSAGIKPIMGCETYLAPVSRLSKEAGRLTGRNYYHQLILARNNVGYRNLSKLVTAGFFEGFYHRPRIDKEILRQHAEGLIGTSSCLAGEVCQLLLKGRDEEALAAAKEYAEIFNGYYYIELQMNCIEEQMAVNPKLVKIARELGLGLVATNDVHYMTREDAEAQDALLAIQTRKSISDPNRLRHDVQEFYLKSPEVMWEQFKEWPEACENTVKIAEMCDVNLKTKEYYFPKLDKGDGISNIEALRNESVKGLEARLKIVLAQTPAEKHDELRKEYTDRLEYELQMIEKMGFADYFLIVSDFINWAKDHGIPVGPGRGCLTGDAQVMMADGSPKALQDVQIADLVFSHTGKPSRVLDTLSYDINESLCRIEVYYGDHHGITMTRDHKVFGEKAILTERYKNLPDAWKSKARKYRAPLGHVSEIPAEQLQPGDWVYFPKLQSTAEIESGFQIDLQPYTNTNACETLVESDLIIERVARNYSFAGSMRDIQRHTKVSRSFLRRYLFSPPDEYAFTKRQQNAISKVGHYLTTMSLEPQQWRERYEQTREYRVSRFLTFDEETMWFIGKWIADGWLNQSKRRGWSVCFNKNEKASIERVEAWLTKQHLTYCLRPHPSEQVLEIEVNSETFRNWLRSIFPTYQYNAQTKMLPTFIGKISDDLLAALLRGYIDGDGYTAQGRIKMTTASSHLAHQIKSALQRLNIPSSISLNTRLDIRPDFANAQPHYIVACPALDPLVKENQAQAHYRYHRFDHGIMCQIKSITNVEGIKKVYDITVEDDSSYATYNGAVHNSAAGSLVAFCTRITDIDPIKHVLLFERFLNPERISMPDIDVDFCESRRDEVIQYVRERYAVPGGPAVSQIITFGKLKAKAVLKDVGRAMDLAYAETDRLAKLIPSVLDITLEEALTQEPRLQKEIKENPRLAKLFDIARRLEGLNRHASVHAAGVVISDGRPLVEHLPLYKGANGEVVTQFDMKGVESVGLIKFDFLGLKNLTLIKNCLDLIKQNRNVEVDMETIDLEDRSAYELLCNADTLGVFQLESSGMRQLITRLRPSCFEDVIALVALYRPGPLQSGMADSFILRKHGQEEIDYIFDVLQPVLGSTYGVCIYQEQVMQIANVLASFSLGEADLLRRAMGKKDALEMEKQRSRFVDGAKQNGYDTAKAEDLFGKVEKFAAYGFNRCLAGDTEIIHAQTGERTTLEELYTNPRPFSVHALGDDWKLHTRDVTDVIDNGIKPTFEIKTALGKTITATANHPFRTLEGWTLLEDLHIGTRIAAPRDAEPQRDPKSDTIPFEVIQWIDKARIGSGVSWEDLQHKADVYIPTTQTLDSTSQKGFRRTTIQQLASFFSDARLQSLAESDVYWDTVVSITPQGTQRTYDLTVESDHNFVANGLIVHNSHSAAYGLVAYQTAWLKAHYRHEYMAALLTADAGNSDKLLLYLNDCRQYKVQVLPPNVNESRKGFVVIGDKIRFGLAGIKGIGDAAIDAIIEARESGPFTGIYDFCERVDLKRVNKRVIEALIKSGAFDDIESVNRASLAAVIDDAVQFGQSIQKDKDSNQISLFDMFANSGPPPKPKIPLLKEWPEKERLQQEKETLGFYISGHPLQRLEKDLKRFASANIADLSDYPSGSEVTIAGIITSKRNMVTKKGEPMAFIVIEDMTGNIEVSVFPRLFTEVCALLDSDEPLLVRGEIESDENQVRMKGAEIRSLIAARNEKAREVHLHLTSADLSEAAARHMLQIFHQHQGSCLALLHLTIPQRSETLIRLPEHIRVEPNEAFEEAIENLFGPRVLSLR